jgi:hypothetical protein
MRNWSLPAVLVFVAAQGWAGAGQSLSHDGEALVLRGLGPGEKAALVAGFLLVDGTLARLTFEKVVATAEGAEGAARWQPAARLPEEGFYLALPLGGGPPLLAGSLRDGGAVSVLPKGRALTFDGAEAHPSLVVACVARPSGGLYCLFSADGSQLDLDGAENGSQTWDVRSFVSVADGEPLEELRPGDHIFMAELRGGTLARAVVGGR